VKGIFVTGTDTGVGKSYIGCALLAGFRRTGLRTVAMKPVASGSEPTPAGLRNEDALQLAAHADCKLAYEMLNPYVFQPAIAPHIAAQETGSCIEIARIVTSYQQISALGADICVVEGAGGWLVPLNETETFADLVINLGLPVVLVVGMRLGCLNHALLTAENILSRGVPLLGWVANQVEPAMPRIESNIETLRSRMPAELLGVVGFQPEAASEKVAELLNIDLLRKRIFRTGSC